jgi:hypothetical protein
MDRWDWSLHTVCLMLKSLEFICLGRNQNGGLIYSKFPQLVKFVKTTRMHLRTEYDYSDLTNLDANRVARIESLVSPNLPPV